MEAAHITWRPLGRVLVEQGLLTGDELERALAEQQTTGQRLGETIVKLGFVSGPELAAALASQYGIELTTEKGFGTGLRSEIQRRHESDRRRVVQLVPDPPTHLEAVPDEPEAEPEVDETPTGEAVLLAQLEEQWAKLAAAEAALADRERELAELTESRAHDLEEQQSKVTALEAALADRERELAEVAERHAHDLHQLEEQQSKLAAAEATLADRERELAELADSRAHALEEQQSKLAETEAALAHRERELAELAERHAHDLHQLEEQQSKVTGLEAALVERERELAESAASRQELEELAESRARDAHDLEELIEGLRTQVQELQVALTEPEESAPAAPTSHLVFVQLGERYELVSRDGPPPELSTSLYLPDVDEGSFVVAGSRRSPLPGDARPCVFVQRG